MLKKSKKAFTLSELLIALAILGIIATFTIPKILMAQQDGRYASVAKEAAGAIASAHHAALLRGGVSTGSGIKDITPYLNYVQLDTVSTIDNVHSYGTVSTGCGTSGARCLKMHNGSMIKYYQQDSFGGSASTNGVVFLLDPDGQATSASPTGPGKSLALFLMYNGKITDISNGATVYYDNGSGIQTWASCPACMPSWFSW